MSRPTLVLVHGRAQAGKHPSALKETWLGALRRGLGPARASILEDVDVQLPFYGDVLEAFSLQMWGASLPDVLVRGPSGDDEERYLDFEAAYLSELGQRLPSGAAQLPPGELVMRGPLNWSWMQALLRAADAIPGASARALERFTRDVFLYLSRSVVRQAVNDVVARAIPASRSVVVGHSLGSVVAYDVLQQAGRRLDVGAYVTVGCPLGVGPVRRALAPVSHPAGVGSWFNALDPRDVVALHPLDAGFFPIQPGVENYAGVSNRTENAHGIDGYLDDPVVAARIADALEAK